MTGRRSGALLERPPGVRAGLAALLLQAGQHFAPEAGAEAMAAGSAASHMSLSIFAGFFSLLG